MTPQARHRAPFELLRFTATPVAGALVVLELEGRFAPSARFGRPPMLVVEPGQDRRRLELAPVRVTAADGHWSGAYAVPADALGAEARLALGLRGTLLELPSPDEPDDGERFTALAREANALRRAVEAAEDDAARARAEAAAASAELGAAVAAAREEAQAAEVRATELQAALEAAEARVAELEALAVEAEAERAAAADAAVEDNALTAEMAAVVDAEARAAAAEAGTEVLRAELAEERERAQAAIAELRRELEAARGRGDADDDETGDGDGDDLDATQPLAAVPDAEPPTTIAPAPSSADADAEDDDSGILEPVAPDPRPPVHPRHGPNLSRWVAVGALVLFAFVLLGLLLGFLA